MKSRKEHTLDLIDKAIKDIREGNKSAAIGKLSAAKGNVHLLEEQTIFEFKRDVVCIGWDGASKPMYRYEDEMHLPDHLRTVVTEKVRKR